MDKSERESRKKIWTPLIYQEQEICPWMGKIYTTTKHNNPDVTALRTHYIHNKHNCSVLALSHCPFSRFFPCLPSTFVVHVHGCLGALRAEHRVLARSLKWGFMRLPPLYLRQTRELAKTVWCWLHVVGIRHWGEVGEAQTLRERISVLSPLTEQWEEAASLPRG